VKDTPVRGKAVLFAGLRRNADLGRSPSVGSGFPPLPTDAPGTKGVLWDPRRGTPSACAQPCACTRRKGDEPLALRADDVLHSVQGPVHVSRHQNSAGASRRRWRVGVDIAVGQTRATERNRHRGRSKRTLRGSPCPTAPAREVCVAHQKRKEVAASVPARIKSPGSLQRTS
jgi:hypothetical protein